MRAILLSLGIALSSGGAAVTQAQSLASRVAAAGDGAVTFHFTARPGVCGDGLRYVRIDRNSTVGYFDEREVRGACIEGPVQVRLTMSGGHATRVESWVGPLRDRHATDLGAFAAPEAANYLLGLVATDAAHADGAVFPAVLADSAVTWPTLLRIARANAGRHRNTSDVNFWLSRFAAAAANGHPNSIGNTGDEQGDDDDSTDTSESMKSQAVFVMSQLPREQAVPGLIQVARTNRDPRVRSRALFWLGQSSDPRALDVFEEFLKR